MSDFGIIYFTLFLSETLNALTDVDLSGNQLQTIPTKVLFRVASKTLTTVKAECVEEMQVVQD